MALLSEKIAGRTIVPSHPRNHPGLLAESYVHVPTRLQPRSHAGLDVGEMKESGLRVVLQIRANQSLHNGLQARGSAGD